MDADMTCKHFNFKANANIARLEDSGRFMCELKIECSDCNKPFQFLGVEPGLNLNGCTVSLDGLELNIAICPEGQRPNPLQGLQGYTIRNQN